jgi:hypothetical protein
LVAGLIAAQVGCSSSSSNAATTTAEAGTDASSITDAGAVVVADGSQTLTLKWVVVEIAAVGYGYGDDGGPAADASDDAATDASLNLDRGDGGNRGVEGLQVCVYQNSAIPCVTTDATGTFTIGGLPPLTSIVLSINKTGYQPLLEAIQTASTPMDGTSDPIFINRTDDAPPPIGVPVEWATTGQVNFFTIGPDPEGGTNFTGIPGAQVSLTPAAPAGSGPYFLDNNGYFAPNATSIVSQLGWYFNLPAGNYELTFIDTTYNCAPIEFPFAGYGVPDPPTSVKFPIVAGYTTALVGVLCTTKPPIVEASAPGH